MAGRPRDPNTMNRVRIHSDKKYRYASTLVQKKSKEGKIHYVYYHWGVVDESLRFFPNKNYKLATVEERNKLIFPEDWDLSEIDRYIGNSVKNQVKNSKKQEDSAPAGCFESVDPQESGITPEQTEGRKKAESCSENDDQWTNVKEYGNKLYGAFWLLENLAKNCGLLDDLIEVFSGNSYLVDAAISLAIFPYLAKRNYNRFSKWQRNNKTLIDDELNASFITRFTQRITDEHRMGLIKCRINRQPKNAHQSCDSTTRSGWGKCLAELRWGKNKDDDNLPDTLEVTVYSLTTHEPIYYRSFGGNVVDMSTVRIILSDLRELGAKDLFFIFDRGYISKTNMAMMVEAGLPFMMCAKTGQSPVTAVLLDVKYDADGLPINLKYIKKEHCYCGQFTIPSFDVTMEDDRVIKVEGLKANVFVDMAKRVEKLREIKDKVDKERVELEKYIEEGYIPKDIKKFNAIYEFHDVKLEEIEGSNKTSGSEKGKAKKQRLIFKQSDKIIEKTKSRSGVFSSVLHGLNYTAEESLIAYKQRDEHEKNWNQMKVQMEFNTQDTSSEDGKAGRQFLIFIGLIIVSKLRSGWKNTGLSIQYNSTYDLIDEMESIRFCEYKNTPSHMTPFTRKQVELSVQLGVYPPEECISPTMREELKRRKKKKEK